MGSCITYVWKSINQQRNNIRFIFLAIVERKIYLSNLDAININSFFCYWLLHTTKESLVLCVLYMHYTSSIYNVTFWGNTVLAKQYTDNINVKTIYYTTLLIWYIANSNLLFKIFSKVFFHFNITDIVFLHLWWKLRG